MSNTPHTLQDEFPGEMEKIHALKTSDAHFARLLQEYDVANDAVHRAETRVDAVSSEHESDLRKTRSRLKDEIARALRA
ncbi:YdcH family protein [Tabrizicola fusiformis]|uniref:YdcH family protein n=1 Tax=Tabrizicola sp. SY72 TaxID=2741673 RepID=UPI0015747DBB|nr:DUF465 domain-containing protein [Tabrizicola sp. SY72]NTT86210.1 DUF465 domain-containing protein [Tabrizicola sp. SY72]